MTERQDYHHKPRGEDCPPNNGCKADINVTCTSPRPTWPELILTAIIKFLSWWIANPILSALAVAIIVPLILLPKATVAIAQCAADGPLHPGDVPGYLQYHPGWQDPGQHPPGWCEDVKSIIDQSINYERIALETSGEVCVKCGPNGEDIPEEPIVHRPPEPLIKGDTDIRLRRSAARACDQFNWIIEYKLPADKDYGDTISDDYMFEPEANQPRGQIALPNFCGRNGARGWLLFDQPRVYYTASSYVDPGDPEGKRLITKRAPYVMFIAMEERSPHIATAYFIYIDDRSERPQLVEITFESLRKKSLISREGNVQLVSNLKMDSDLQEVTFQIGARAQAMTIAGEDFGADMRAGDDPAIGGAGVLNDTSGAYVVELNRNGAVDDVYRKGEKSSRKRNQRTP